MQLTQDQIAKYRVLGRQHARTSGPLERHVPTAADLITLLSFGLGAWWTVGGPVWAGLASILGDELDGRLARATRTASERGSELDWGSDIILTTMTLMRLGHVTRHEGLALVTAVPFLYTQASLRAAGWRPPVLSARALLMIGTMLVERR